MDGELAIKELVPTSVVYGCRENTVNMVERRIPLGGYIEKDSPRNIGEQGDLLQTAERQGFVPRSHWNRTYAGFVAGTATHSVQTTWEHCAGAASARKRVCVMRFHETILELLGKTVPIQRDNMHKPLPRRWVDLIHYLEEQERREREKNGAGVKKLDS